MCWVNVTSFLQGVAEMESDEFTAVPVPFLPALLSWGGSKEGEELKLRLSLGKSGVRDKGVFSSQCLPLILTGNKFN